MQWFKNRHVRGRPPHPDVLTPAEWRVLDQLRLGHSNAEIADQLHVALPTVKMHVSNMLAKLELPDRYQLAAWDGEPAEASRTARGRMHLAGPLGWLGERVATWAGRIALGAGAVAAGAVFLIAMQSMNESGAPLGAGPAATPPAPTATATEAPAAPPQSTFVVAASPEIARSFHSATLLNGGTVLVAGGCCVGSSGLVAEAERYDPDTNRWSPAGALVFPRQTHTATLLPDGRVVLIGGVGMSDPSVEPYPYLAEIEIYDPELGVFAVAGTLSAPRVSHDAILMPDGRVLVIGGIGRGDRPRNMEIFDPTTGGTVSLSVELPPAFDMPRALLVGESEVLIVGGGEVAIFDLAAGTLDHLSPPEGLDAWPTNVVALADGSVLFAGGCCEENDTLSDAALLMPSARAGHKLPGMSTGRTSQTMTLLADGRILIVGGLANAGHGFGEALATVELFDPTIGDFGSLPPMSEPRTNHTATRLPDGSVLVVGPNNLPDPGTFRFIP